MTEPTALTELTTPAPLPEDLQKQIAAVCALATTHNLLKETPVPQVKFDAVTYCMQFVNSLYEDTVAVALAHPDAEKSEDLMKLKAHREKVKSLDEARLEKAKEASKSEEATSVES